MRKPLRIQGNYVERFWGHAQPKGANECWPWHGARNVGGYGAANRHAINVPAHRMSYEINIGPIADGMKICHTCDNPPCVNPEHLFTGTQQDNLRDMERKGRRSGGALRGEHNPASKLTEESVRDIRAALSSGVIQRDLADKYGVTQAVISQIKRRASWKHVPATTSGAFCALTRGK